MIWAWRWARSFADPAACQLVKGSVFLTLGCNMVIP